MFFTEKNLCLKHKAGSYFWFNSGKEYERKFLYHDLYQSIFHDFWLIFVNIKKTNLLFVAHLLNEKMKIVKELIFIGPDNINEAFVDFQKYFPNDNFGGIEVFNISLLDDLNFLSQGFSKPVISYKHNHKILKDFEIIDNSHKNIFDLCNVSCPITEEIMNEMNPLSLWGEQKEFRKKYHLWFDANKDSATTEKGTIVEDENQFNDNLYNPRFIGTYGQLDHVDINYDNTSEYKRGTSNKTFNDKESAYVNKNINDTINRSYDIISKFILKNLNDNEKQSPYKIIKNSLNFINSNKNFFLTNYGLDINKNNINKVIKYILKNAGK